jgi:hypothetical protein
MAHSTGNADASLVGWDPNVEITSGSLLAIAGDVDADGRDDMLVGSLY